jgi:threonine aldolase
MTLTDAEVEALSLSCPRALSGWGRAPLADEAADLADEAARGGDRDRYGSGGVVAEVEQQVQELLGLPAAVLCPTGTLAQQVALRHWCGRSPSGSARVALHATAHPVMHEDDALSAVQGLVPVVVGDRVGLDAVREEHARRPLGAVLVELPYRETGGQLATYEELSAMSAWCREAGVALHLDGARLWDCGPAYLPRTLAQVAALFDSVYVSLYKALGAPGGAVLLGPPELVEHARLWRHRLGGSVVSLWPIALGARRGLRERLPRVPVWLEHAQALADALAAAGVEVLHRPEVPMLHPVLPAEPERALPACAEVARDSGVWLGRPYPSVQPGTSRVEVSVQDSSLDVPPEEGAALLARVVAALA